MNINKVGLSLSALSWCWFTSINGWAGEFYYNSPNTISKKPTTTAPESTTSPSTTTTPESTTSPSTTTTLPSTTTQQPYIVSMSCIQKITTTRNGQVTTTEGFCPTSPATLPENSSCVQKTITTYSNGQTTITETSCPTPSASTSSGRGINF